MFVFIVVVWRWCLRPTTTHLNIGCCWTEKSCFTSTWNETDQRGEWSEGNWGRGEWETVLSVEDDSNGHIRMVETSHEVLVTWDLWIGKIKYGCCIWFLRDEDWVLWPGWFTSIEWPLSISICKSIFQLYFVHLERNSDNSCIILRENQDTINAFHHVTSICCKYIA